VTGLSTPGTSWWRLQVVAPGESDAIVKVRLVAESGTFAPAGLDVIEVPAGTVKDVDLAPFGTGDAFAVDLDSDVPVTAGVLDRVTAPGSEVEDVAYAAAGFPLRTTTPGVVPEVRVGTGVTSTLLLGAPAGAAHVRLSVLPPATGTPRELTVPAGSQLPVDLATLGATGSFAVLVRPMAGSGRLYAVAVHPSAQGRHLGRALVEHTLEALVLQSPRPVVVVARVSRHDEELKELRRFIHEQRPVLVGVDGGAHVLLAHRLRPDVVLVSAGLVGSDDDDALTESVLREARELVVHERRSERTAAADRLQRWGIGAPRVTSDADTFDLALLLVHGAGASMIVPVGRDAGFEEFLDRGRADQASTFLTRLRVGQHLVDASAVPALYTGRVRGWHLLVILIVALVALWLAMATTPIGNVWWHDVGDWIQARFDDIEGLFT